MSVWRYAVRYLFLSSYFRYVVLSLVMFVLVRSFFSYVFGYLFICTVSLVRYVFVCGFFLYVVMFVFLHVCMSFMRSFSL